MNHPYFSRSQVVSNLDDLSFFEAQDSMNPRFFSLRMIIISTGLFILFTGIGAGVWMMDIVREDIREVRKDVRAINARFDRHLEYHLESR